jgi:hypothetical protein
MFYSGNNCILNPTHTLFDIPFQCGISYIYMQDRCSSPMQQHLCAVVNLELQRTLCNIRNTRTGQVLRQQLRSLSIARISD